MTGPRSTRLLTFQSTAPSLSPAFQCPAGNVVIVKGVSFQNAGTAVAHASINGRTSGSNIDVVFQYATVQPGTGDNYTLYAVLNPGDLLYAWTDAASVHVWASGSVLAGTPPITPADLAQPAVLIQPPDWLKV